MFLGSGYFDVNVVCNEIYIEIIFNIDIVKINVGGDVKFIGGFVNVNYVSGMILGDFYSE